MTHKKTIKVKRHKRKGKKVKGHKRRIKKKSTLMTQPRDLNSAQARAAVAEKGWQVFDVSNPDFQFEAGRIVPFGKVRKSMLQHGNIRIFQPGPVPADRAIRSGRNIHHVGLSQEQEQANRAAEKRLKKLMGF